MSYACAGAVHTGCGGSESDGVICPSGSSEPSREEQQNGQTSLRVCITIHDPLPGAGGLGAGVAAGAALFPRPSRPPSVFGGPRGRPPEPCMRRHGGSERDGQPEVTRPGAVGLRLSLQGAPCSPFFRAVLLTGSHGGRSAGGPDSGEWRVPRAFDDSEVGAGVC